MINPKKELFVWGPIDGRPIYVSYFMIAIAERMPKLYRHKWPEIYFYFIKDRTTFISEYPALRAAGKGHFNTWIMNDAGLRKAEKNYKNALNNLMQLQSKLSANYLNSLSNKSFANEYLNWQGLYLNFWAVGLVPEMANFGGEQVLKEELHKKIKNQKEFITAFEKLSAPESISFYQEEELDLLRLKKHGGTRKLNVLLEKHAQKYFWIRNSYFEQQELKADYFWKLLSKLEKAHFKIKKIETFSDKVRCEKKIIIMKHNLDKKIVKTSDRLSHSIWWQDSRKKQIFIANHYLDLFLKEISKRKKVRFTDLRFYWPAELVLLLEKNRIVPAGEILKRKSFALMHYHNNVLSYKTGKKEKELIRPFLVKKAKLSDKITGTVVSAGSGKVKGRVKILLSPRNLGKMKKGDILVAPMTSPDYIVAIRKAAAIVTDEGGLTCHAAIVSRELGIPCIVGTKIATKILKDDDKVEVNANHGVVYIRD